MFLSKKTNCSVCGSSMTRKTLRDGRTQISMTWATYWCDNKHCDNVLSTVIEANGKLDDPRMFRLGLLGATYNTTKSTLEKMHLEEV